MNLRRILQLSNGEKVYFGESGKMIEISGKGAKSNIYNGLIGIFRSFYCW